MENSSEDKKPQRLRLAGNRIWDVLLATFWAILALEISRLAVGYVLDFFAVNVEHSGAAVQFAVQAVLYLIIAGILYLVLTKIYKKDLRSVGFTRLKMTHINQGIIAYPLYMAAAIGGAFLIGLYFPGIDLDQKQEIGFTGAAGLQLVWVFISLVIIPPLVEEFIFRGFLYKGYVGALGPVFGSLLVSILFAVAHGQVNVAIDTFILSLFLCYLRYKHDSLWAPITLHALKNLVAFILLFIIGVK